MISNKVYKYVILLLFSVGMFADISNDQKNFEITNLFLEFKIIFQPSIKQLDNYLYKF